MTPMFRLLLLGLLVPVVPVLAAGPPARPVSMTPAQFEGIRTLEAQPEHAAILDLRATYASDRERRLAVTRAVDDVLTAAAYIGYPGFVLAILIIAL